MPTGISSGNNNDLGHYDQCKDSHHWSGSGIFDPGYCQVPLQSIKQNVSFVMAVCVPSTCSSHWVYLIMTRFMANVEYKIDHTNSYTTYCVNYQQKTFGVTQWITITLLAIFGIFLLLSTIYDLRIRQQNQEPDRLYASFSVYTNINKLLQIHVGKSEETFQCLNGLRVIAIGYVVLLHIYEYSWFMPAIFNRDFPLKFKGSWGGSFMRHGDVAVETFFVITGLLLSYNFMKAREKGIKFSLVKYYTHRFFRIAPAFYIAMLMVVAFVQYLGDGPVYAKVTEDVLRGNCVKYWWSSLIFVSNWHPSSLFIVSKYQ